MIFFFFGNTGMREFSVKFLDSGHQINPRIDGECSKTPEDPCTGPTELPQDMSFASRFSIYVVAWTGQTHPWFRKRYRPEKPGKIDFATMRLFLERQVLNVCGHGVLSQKDNCIHNNHPA